MAEHRETQATRFTQTARAIGADEDEAAFRAKLAVIARHKPKEDVPEPPSGDREKRKDRS